MRGRAAHAEPAGGVGRSRCIAQRRRGLAKEVAGQAPAASQASRTASTSITTSRPEICHGVQSDLQPPVIAWSVSKSLDDMDKSGVATAITSVTTPGSAFSGKDGRRVARECNEYARAAGAGSSRPLRHVRRPAAHRCRRQLREIEFGLDVLGPTASRCLRATATSGSVIPAFEPVMAELNRRKAVIYTHPDAPNCCRDPMVPEIASR